MVLIRQEDYPLPPVTGPVLCTLRPGPRVNPCPNCGRTEGNFSCNSMLCVPCYRMFISGTKTGYREARDEFNKVVDKLLSPWGEDDE